MEKEKIYEIGKKLGISTSDVKIALIKNRNKIMTSIVLVIASILINRIWFEPLHYTVASIKDFNFLTRFL